MKSLTSLGVSLLLIVATLLNSGCAATKDGRKTQAQGAAIGAVGGAILGGLIGVATGSTENAVRFAAIGAVAGGAGGFAYGTAVAKRKARYARAEQWLNVEIALARQARGRAIAYNGSLKRRIAALEARGGAARTARNKAGMRAVKAEIAQIQKEASVQSRNDETTGTEVKQVLGDAKARGAANYSAYQSEARSFDQAQAERGQLSGRLASLNNSLDR